MACIACRGRVWAAPGARETLPKGGGRSTQPDTIKTKTQPQISQKESRGKTEGRTKPPNKETEKEPKNIGGSGPSWLHNLPTSKRCEPWPATRLLPFCPWGEDRRCIWPLPSGASLGPQHDSYLLARNTTLTFWPATRLLLQHPICLSPRRCQTDTTRPITRALPQPPPLSTPTICFSGPFLRVGWGLATPDALVR